MQLCSRCREVIDEKRCSRCKKWKKLEMFSKNKSHEDGLNTWCRLCQSEYAMNRGIEK